VTDPAASAAVRSSESSSWMCAGSSLTSLGRTVATDAGASTVSTGSVAVDCVTDDCVGVQLGADEEHADLGAQAGAHTALSGV
jgi:hypothetical protein